MVGIQTLSFGRAGGIVGTILGGLILGGLGVYAFIIPDGSIIWSLSFIIAFISAMFGFLAPLVLFLYVGSTSRFLSVYRIGGYLLSIVSIFVLGLAGTWLLPILDISTPLMALVLFDIFIGGTFGGIFGKEIAVKVSAHNY